MTFHADLLRQAKQLARRHSRQANLRRAVSAAYYALFHLLIHEATRSLSTDPELRSRFSRAFDHADMKNASRKFANPSFDGMTIPDGLQDVAQTFVDLQEARHQADYDLSQDFTKSHVDELVARVDQAFRLWRTVRTDPATQYYLAALLIVKKWNR